jgi:hypothetical protein
MIAPVSLGTFARFDGTRCRWRLENGAQDLACSLDAYGRRARRAWVNLVCNRSLPGRGALVSVTELLACDFNMTVNSAEVCN